MFWRALITIYPAPALGNHSKKSPRRKSTSEEQKKRNDKYSMWRLQALIYTNFVAGKDLFTTFTCPDKTNEADAKKMIANAIKYFRNYCKLQGYKFKYIMIPEKQGQWHFHLIMSYIPYEVIWDYWKRYSKKLDFRPLDDSQGYFDTATYLLTEEKYSFDDSGNPINKKKKRKKNEKRWTCSHGLLEAEDSYSILEKMPKEKPRAPKGYRIDESSIKKTTDTWGTYMTCECVWIGGKNLSEGMPRAYERLQKKAIAMQEQQMLHPDKGKHARKINRKQE